ncbi:hypothetical protein ABMA28_012948 [Loxostege sticticalis]|uniref:Uncharacterized protein n=1 Tax=Loxostege sticticalis TaxID=481309 RepID=A0ABD0S355_LOXSC
MEEKIFFDYLEHLGVPREDFDNFKREHAVRLDSSQAPDPEPVSVEAEGCLSSSGDAVCTTSSASFTTAAQTFSISSEESSDQKSDMNVDDKPPVNRRFPLPEDARQLLTAKKRATRAYGRHRTEKNRKKLRYYERAVKKRIARLRAIGWDRCVSTYFQGPPTLPLSVDSIMRIPTFLHKLRVSNDDQDLRVLALTEHEDILVYLHEFFRKQQLQE